MEAVYSGMQPGLTIIVGPPGTGKTDVAVQIISNIYHNFPDQRTIIEEIALTIRFWFKFELFSYYVF
jgi:replicative DNA helicase